MEQKLLPQFTKSIDDRTVSGIFAVHGNIDDGQDRSWPGSFANVTVNGRSRTRFLWMHRSEDPPIAAIKSIRELTRPDLPQSVLDYAPDATGGVEVVREYLDTPRGDEVLKGIKAGAIDEMSYAYDVTDSKDETVEGIQVRNIYGIKLYDISDVTWGLNPATVAVKSKLLSGLTLIDHSETVLTAAQELVARYDQVAVMNKHRRLEGRSGRILSAANVERAKEIHEGLTSLLAKLEALLALAEPEKTRRNEALRLRSASNALRRRVQELGV